MSGGSNPVEVVGNAIGSVFSPGFNRDSGSPQRTQNKENLDKLTAAQNDPNVDALTKRDIAKGLAAPIDPNTPTGTVGGVATGTIDQLISILSQSKSGSGIYGVRKINEAQRNIAAAYPGRSQTTPSLGGGSKLGSFF